MNSFNEEREYNEKDIIEELHETREQLLAKFDGDLRALFDDARLRDAASKEETVNREGLKTPNGNHQSQAQAS